MQVSQQSKPKLNATRIIGIDYGLARIGLAVSDERKIIANSLKTLPAEKKTLATAHKLVKELQDHAALYGYEIQEIVIGMPLMMNGKKGMLADEVIHFISLLKEQLQTPIITWDERLSSVQADRSLREGNFSRKRRSKMVDSVAATIILQSYLDHKSIMSQNLDNLIP
jgi:putative Holliday junction resolvase